MSSSDSTTPKGKSSLGGNSEEFIPDNFFSKPASSIDSFRVWNPFDSVTSPNANIQGEKVSEQSPSTHQSRLFQHKGEPDDKKFEEEYERGFKDGKEAYAIELEQKSSDISSLLALLKSGQCDVSDYYSPLKTLAVRIAEAILKVELMESRESIAKIVKDLLDEAAPSSESPATLYLSQDDLHSLSPEFVNQQEDVKLVGDEKLSRGSAYVEMNDRLITDLKEDRIKAVVQKVIPHG